MNGADDFWCFGDIGTQDAGEQVRDESSGCAGPSQSLVISTKRVLNILPVDAAAGDGGGDDGGGCAKRAEAVGSVQPFMVSQFFQRLTGKSVTVFGRDAPVLRPTSLVAKEMLDSNVKLAQRMASVSETMLPKLLHSLRDAPRHFLNEPSELTDSRLAVRTFEIVCRAYYASESKTLAEWYEELTEFVEPAGVAVSAVGAHCVCIEGRLDGSIFANFFLILRAARRQVTDDDDDDDGPQQQTFDPEKAQYSFAVGLLSQQCASYFMHMVAALRDDDGAAAAGAIDFSAACGHPRQ
jgi:hypothetical protein